MATSTKVKTAGRQQTTLKTIAERLSVSTATVSLALRDSPLVARDTRERIKLTAREIGYVYNRSAASLRTQRTNIIGVAFYDIVNPYFAEMLSRIEDELSLRKHTTLLCQHGENVERQTDFIETLMQYRADGVILCPAEGTSPEEILRINSVMPVVLMCRSVDGVRVDRVGSDDELGMRRATEHLVGQGYRRIAMIGGSPGVSTGHGRISGYRAVLEEAGIGYDPALQLPGPFTRNFGDEAIERLMAMDDPPTAAVCMNDLNAFGVMMGLRRHGLEPGRDFGLVGYDDVDEATHWTPRLSTVFNNQTGIGSNAARLLLERIEDPDRPPVELVLEPELRIRESSISPTVSEG